MSAQPLVVCFQQRLTHYREVFFTRVRAALERRGISFALVHGTPDAAALTKKDSGKLDWADEVAPINIPVGRSAGVWISCPKRLSNPSLVIVTQENKLFANYAWLLRRVFGRVKVAYWGHGRNFQAKNPTGFGEKWKQLLVGRVDWWFAYTQMTRDILLQDAYPDSRITVLDNAIDNQSFINDLNSITDERLSALRAELGLSAASRVGLFCGSLYPDKRIGFMVEAADRIRAAIPDFHWVVIGDGPSAAEVKEAAATRPWIHWVGVRKGVEKASYFRLADIVLNPGLVGLHILDSFCAGVPMVTTTDARHSPEVVYLENGINGLMLAGDANAYGAAIVDLLNDPVRYNALRQGALAGAERYTLDNMVNNFVDGIARCLATPKK